MIGRIRAARLDPMITRIARLRCALADLANQEFSYSTGHLATILNGCLFAPSLFTFWFVNGVLDFSTAVAIGAVATPVGLQLRVIAYLLLVPTFLLVRITVHLSHPGHRKQILAGSCPQVRLLSLDWVSLGILATGLPLALRTLGPWLGMNAVFLVGVFVLPRVLPTRRAGTIKLAAIALGSALFLYANYGGAVPWAPTPSAVLGPVATLALGDDTVRRLSQLANSILFGPLFVAAFGLAMNRLLTRPEVADIPLVRHAIPTRDADSVVVISAAFGTVFYLLVVGAVTGRVIVIP